MRIRKLLGAATLMLAFAVVPVTSGSTPAYASGCDGGGSVPGNPGGVPDEPEEQDGPQMTPEEMRAFVARHESPYGLQGNPHVYNDTKGIPTVGVGFNLNRSDAREKIAAVGANYDAVRAGTQNLTQQQITTLFEADYLGAVKTVQRHIRTFATLSSTRQAVLVDMAFNLGPAGFAAFKNLINAVNTGNWEAAARAMTSSLWYQQVKTRGVQDVKLMRQGAVCEPVDMPPAPTTTGGNPVNYPHDVPVWPGEDETTVGGNTNNPIACSIRSFSVYYENHWVDVIEITCG
ncbi:glycoside hydrolase family protein [Actinoplanes sp. NPDC048988]|uniref:glycoside hydrolase family protein n=1 Tax=Actinoplanes sp. NPDC048988 TaxID=3363901 RepID=UPI00371F4F50